MSGKRPKHYSKQVQSQWWWGMLKCWVWSVGALFVFVLADSELHC